MCACDFAAGTNEAEGDDGDARGVGDVTKQLEEQTLEERERAEDAEEGISSPHQPLQQQWTYRFLFSPIRSVMFDFWALGNVPEAVSMFFIFLTALKLTMLTTDGDEGENSASKKKRKKKKKKGCERFTCLPQQ